VIIAKQWKDQKQQSTKIFLEFETLKRKDEQNQKEVQNINKPEETDEETEDYRSRSNISKLKGTDEEQKTKEADPTSAN